LLGLLECCCHIDATLMPYCCHIDGVPCCYTLAHCSPILHRNLRSLTRFTATYPFHTT
jgi:hypothetical protein